MSKRYQGGVLGVGFNPLRAPNAPTVGTATAGGNNCASVAFTAPACVGGSAVTGYTAQSNPTGYSGAAAGSPITVSGLTNGTSYTFGVFALNSYGPSPISAFSNSITAAQDGTFGIFALGCVSSGTQVVRNKYTYSSCAVGSATSANMINRRGAATGNSTAGIFALGYGCNGVQSIAVTNREKYTYSNNVVSTGGAATSASQNGSAAGNSTVGIFALGTIGCSGGSTNRDKYTYSGCVVSGGGSASCNSERGSATGNTAIGIFSLGRNGFSGTRLTTRNKYTYSNDSVTSATSANTAGQYGSAAGNSTVGIFAIGCSSSGNTTAREKYTYSGCVVTSATAASVAASLGSAAGNGAVGIFALGSGNSGRLATRNKYTYSNDALAAGGAATVASCNGSAASNGISGVTL